MAGVLHVYAVPSCITRVIRVLGMGTAMVGVLHGSAALIDIGRVAGVPASVFGVLVMVSVMFRRVFWAARPYCRLRHKNYDFRALSVRASIASALLTVIRCSQRSLRPFVHGLRC